jgi:hypothetical protein
LPHGQVVELRGDQGKPRKAGKQRAV